MAWADRKEDFHPPTYTKIVICSLVRRNRNDLESVMFLCVLSSRGKSPMTPVNPEATEWVCLWYRTDIPGVGTTGNENKSREGDCLQPRIS